MSTRLDRHWLSRLPASVERPRYALDAVHVGIVHFGPGAFHRAHQAWYIDDALASDPRWGICAVSLCSAGPSQALAAQDGLYTVNVLDAAPRYRVVGALRECLVATQRERLFTRLVAPTTSLVTLTVTEKGYCLDADGTLDFAHPDIVADCASPLAPVSAIGNIVEGLRLRRAAGVTPFTSVSCDNLSDNGVLLRNAVIALARAREPGLADWIERNATFPRTMVDSIVPAADAALAQRVASALGATDTAPVQREVFAQWVIEDRFCNAVPDFTRVGVEVANDVGDYERAKLRLLNAAHSTLAYLGSLRGHATTNEAMRDAALATFVERLMREDIAPHLVPCSGFALDRYIDSTLARFRNPAVQHQLAQIAWDGSKKLPIRILGTLRDAIAARRPLRRLCVPLAAWLIFLCRAQRTAATIVDPMADALSIIAAQCDGDAAHDVPLWLALTAVFGADLPRHAAFASALSHAYSSLRKTALPEDA